MQADIVQEAREKSFESARRKARKVWRESSAEPPADGHPYLQAKGVEAHGIRFRNGHIVIALRTADGQIASLQYILAEPLADGRAKTYLTGGKKSGAFHLIGDITNTDNPIYVAEGYATAATLHEVTGCPAVMACDANNLMPVIANLRKAYGADRQLIICADDDRWTEGNPGVSKAMAAAKEHGCQVAVPKFSNPKKGETDFNDLMAAEGEAAVGKFADTYCAGRNRWRNRRYNKWRNRGWNRWRNG